MYFLFFGIRLDLSPKRKNNYNKTIHVNNIKGYVDLCPFSTC